MYSPNYKITNNLLKYIGRIEACKEVIANAPLVPAWESKFRDDARSRTIHHGTHLEGNDLTMEQAQLIIHSPGTTVQAASESSGVTARDHDIQEVINYRNVLNWIDDWGSLSNRQVQYSDHMLKELHTLTTQRILPPEQVGNYRTVQVVVRSVTDGSVAFRPPAAAQIPTLISDLITWLNSPQNRDVHSVIRAGIAHYELVRIHPFIEGNGRTSRAFALLLLYAEGYDIKKLFSLEEYFDRDIDGYYRALLSVQQSNELDMTYWLEYFCFGLAIELDRMKQKVLKLSQDAKLKHSLGGVQIALSEREIAILELLQEKRYATTSEINKILPMVSPDTILRDLKDMLKKGLLKKEGVTKGVVYFLKEK
ncbi:hypothetical protein C5B42_04305 [Candidatus Cerribacteria bacterium 'Amazon FNV 2010 28 9']|uniref:Fido domain-containing protein n=1 Tax=Candidatus Cerribacteria bacterium 'Amazon FNV 2010 28 9' TaxID=2081795 RepID=A0A317JPF1_9BACT|nr:MAG: hypothetical protein C5B42_04305 [Candidatus Cerribacteria bacterium 'Amazon FNV 2010 28 9']